MVYLDYAANTPVDKEALDLFYDLSLKYYANPNSSHKFGVSVQNMLKEYMEKTAEILGVGPQEIIYTSGATESNNLAIKGICERYISHGKHILISAFEHNSIVASATYMQERGFEVEIIPVEKSGLIDIETLEKKIRDDTIIISISSVDSELGIRQPIEKIASFLKRYPNIVFHTDASQAIGKCKIDFSDVDLITIAPHKFYGLNGIGILIKKNGIGIKPQIHGGKSTTIYRSGTPIMPLVGATFVSLYRAIDTMEERQNYIKRLNEKVRYFLISHPGVSINTPVEALPNILNFSIKGVKSSIFVENMSSEFEVYLSSKTSCCPISTPSKLVYALTHDKSKALTSVRLSLSHLTSDEDIDKFCMAFDKCYEVLYTNGKI